MPLKSQAFTASGDFDVPAGVSCLWLKMIGAGACGSVFIISLGGGVFAYVQSGGGSGGLCMGIPVNVTPGATIAITVGTGGAAALYPQNTSNFGNRGGDSIVSGIRVAGGYPPELFPSNNGFSRDTWGSGGGAGAPVDVYANHDGVPGVISTLGFFSGASGAGRWNAGILPNGTVGGPAVNNHPGGSPGAFTPGVSTAGAGGGSSPFGVGGTGGDVTTTNPAPTFPGNGHAPTAGAYGAGGGGGGTWNPGYSAGQPIGGAGADGYVLVSWVG